MTVLADLAAAVERGWRFGAKTGIASITCSIETTTTTATTPTTTFQSYI